MITHYSVNPRPRYLSEMRLNKYLAHAGLSSRRGSDDIIRAGRVAVNGEIIEALGVKVSPETDLVTVDGLDVEPVKQRYYYLLNKPTGYITTVSDPFGRKTVMSLISDIPHRIYPVGRLDKESEGLLLFTNDGDLSFKMVHPRFGIEKEYRVLVEGCPVKSMLDRLSDGVPVNGKITAPCTVELLDKGNNTAWLSFVLHEGRKRQIRHMCGYIGHPVKQLIRIRIGSITTGNLSPGKWRTLECDEIKQLKKLTDD